MVESNLQLYDDALNKSIDSHYGGNRLPSQIQPFDPLMPACIPRLTSQYL